MVPFSKFVELHEELISCCGVVEQHLNSILGDDVETFVEFGVDDELQFGILCSDNLLGFKLKSVVGKEDYSTMLKITSKSELLSFLEERKRI